MKTKNLIEAAVSFGAAVVVLGALFKLEHLAFASTFLWVGLGIEAVIFTVYGIQELFKKPEVSQNVPHGTVSVSHGDSSENTKAIKDLNNTIKSIFNR